MNSCVGIGLTDECALYHAVSVHTTVEAFYILHALRLSANLVERCLACI